MRLRELMKHNPVVITQDWTLREAAQKMLEVGAGVLPVVDGDKNNPGTQAIGVLTDRDIVVRCIAKGKDPNTVKVVEAFTKQTVFGKEDDSERQAFEAMRGNDIGRLLVKDQRGNLVGIVSMSDIIANVPGNIWDKLPGNENTKMERKQAS